MVTPTATVTPARSAQSTSAAQPAAQTPLATPTATQRTYTVKSGDSLSKIAQQAYGQANQWSAIFEANRDKISDPDKIFPGQVLVLPNLPSVH
ncbi:LysM peptidoglycan-binding domain-containing protein [Lysobacter xanthus]